MNQESLVIKPIRRISPSRYTAMQDCLLREVWTAAGNEPLLPPSPLAELGTVIHRIIEAAGRGQLSGGEIEKVDSMWDKLVSEVENKMTLSALSRHKVPLSRIIPDFQVRKLRACHRASDIAHDAFRTHTDYHQQSLQSTNFEVWVESDDGQVGGYIDRVALIKDGIVLSDYKSGAILDYVKEDSGGKLKQAYKVQLEIYAALYYHKCGAWPIRLEVVPLQGTPVDVAFTPEGTECLLSEASAFLQSVNKKIAEVENGSASIATLASPQPMHCKFCLFRPACQAYWMAMEKSPEEKWPPDVRGFLRETAHLRNGKVCIRIAETDPPVCPFITVRNLTACADRHPILGSTAIGRRIAIYGLHYNHHSGDYTETQDTVIYGTD